MDLFNRQPKKPIQKSHKYLNNKTRSTEYTENRLASTVDGKRVKGSGCSGEKGDFYSSTFLYESKRTSNQVVSISLKHLEKIEDEASSSGKRFALVSTFLKTDSGNPKDYVTISMSDFYDLIHTSKE